MNQKKEDHDAHLHQSSSRKRKFSGDQFSLEQETEFTTTTASKILNETDIFINSDRGYCIVSFLSVFTALAQIIVCKKCKKDIKFGETGHQGLGFKIVLMCECGNRSIHSGPLINDKAYEINERLVLVMRLLGVGHDGIKLFCGLMDLGNDFSINMYKMIMNNIYSASKAVFKLVTKKAVEEEKTKNAEKEMPISNLTVSGGGTWEKRNSFSLSSVSTLIGNLTGKVIDAVVREINCPGCFYWMKKDKNTEEYANYHARYEEKCSVFHVKSASEMKISNIREMFFRSNELYGVRYVNYIGDSDPENFKSILDFQPYGEGIVVKTSVDINHVHKRMSMRLLSLKRSKNFKKGIFTYDLIEELTTKYGLAIRCNDNVQDMKNAIMAMFNHMTSPNHDLPLAPELAKELLPIYNDLSREDILERCLNRHTRHSDESLNAYIWRLAPKHLYCDLKTIEIAMFLSSGIFNEGYYAILKIMQTMGIYISPKCKAVADEMDSQRMDQLTQSKDFFEKHETFYGPRIAH